MASMTRETPPKTSREMPFIVSLFFLFVYVSIFYACSLSPSSVLNSSTFWFFMSNTLIFIIAADYGAFSPPRQKLVVYLRQEYYQTHIQTKPIVFENPERNNYEAFEEKEEDPENCLIKRVVENDPENPNDDSLENNTLTSMETMKNQEKPVEESKPEKVKREETIEEADQISKMTDDTFSSMETTKNREKPVEESKPDKVEQEEAIEEADQFSKLTDEELNRRVDEFIKKFNKQIRLQKIQEKLQKSGTI